MILYVIFIISIKSFYEYYKENNIKFTINCWGRYDIFIL